MVSVKYSRRNLAESSEVESWKQSRAVNEGATTPKVYKRRSERDGIVDHYRFT